MSSPTDEKEQYSFPAFEPNQPTNMSRDRRSSDEDGTLQGEPPDDAIDHNHLRVTTSYAKGHEHLNNDHRDTSPMSPSAQREQSRRLEDDLEMLRAERVVTSAEKSNQDSLSRSRSMVRSRSRTNAEPIDDFDVGTTPIHEKTKVYQPPANPTTKVAKFFKKIHNASFLVRYFCYITPLVLLLLIPLLFGLLLFQQSTVGGVKLFWFGIWLEIVWLTLWAGRVSPFHLQYILSSNKNSDSCEMHSVAHGYDRKPFHEQRKEMEGPWQSIGGSSHALLLVACGRDFLLTNNEEPSSRRRQSNQVMGDYCQQNHHFYLYRSYFELY